MKNSTQPGRLKQATTKQTLKWASGIALMLLTFFNPWGANAQQVKPFTQRSSIYSPEKKVYHIQGDYQMIGNSNLTRSNVSESSTGPSSTSNNNNATMKYIDVDDDNSTVNSSRAQLKFSTEHGANPECTNVIYAGLYWTGRKSKSSSGEDLMSYVYSDATEVSQTSGNTTNGYRLFVSKNVTKSSGYYNFVTTYTYTPVGGGDNVVFTFSGRAADNNGNNLSNTSLTVKVGGGVATALSANFEKEVKHIYFQVIIIMLQQRCQFLMKFLQEIQL